MRAVFRIWSTIRPYWRRLVLACACLLSGTALDLAIPWILRETIDVGLAGGRPHFMVMVGLTVAGGIA